MFRLSRNTCVGLAVAAAATLVGLACGADEPARKILRKEEVSPSTGKVFKTYEYYLDERGREVKHGLDTLLMEDGKKLRDLSYADGRLHGPDITYDSSGDVSRRGQWKHGRQEGTWEGVESDGTLRSVETYKHGKPIGPWRYWRKGVLIREDTFDAEGERVKLAFFHDDGTKRMLGTYLPRQLPDFKIRKSGTWTYWDRSGKVVADGVWKEGKPFSGVCGVRLESDVGSAGGIEIFGRFEEGKLVEKVTVDQFSPPPKPAK